MVKKLADELSDILDWVENPGLGEHAHEEAKCGLICFCRGLVVGLRASEPIEVRGDIPIDPSFAKDWNEAERRAKVAADRRRSREENAQRNEAMMGKQADNRLRPLAEEALKDCGFTPDCH